MTSWASVVSRSMSARHDPADLVLDLPAHGEQGLLERVQLLVEVPLHGGPPLAYPNRPVM